MSSDSPDRQRRTGTVHGNPSAPGRMVAHPELGEGVVVGVGQPGFLRVFFRSVGERQVAIDRLGTSESWSDRVLHSIMPVNADRIARLRLAIDAVRLPLQGNQTRLTAAKVDLLPHQVVLVHRVALAHPRRFLIADEVGLGKTVETALILRELASRGELERALMVVPAGLVENWRRELNDVFNLDFEVFGSEGDVTDRKSNAFARHPRLIASIDTLKRPARIKRLLDAPAWDLVVFDEAQHLSAFKSGKKVRRTENYKLGEALRGHCRDLLLLSATPHQGDHFRFWQLIRLLEPTLFQDEQDLVANRHRLNAVVVRRSKADACDADGGTLFVRRMVTTTVFRLSPNERSFYDRLTAYMQDGYNLAKQLGGSGTGLGLVMTIFQKIASSSFAAVRATLRRRLLMLTVAEAIHCEERLEVEGRDRALGEARAMLRDLHGLGDGTMARAAVDRLLAEAKLKILKKRSEEDLYFDGGDVIDSSTGEETAATLVENALPEERQRIRALLDSFPSGDETKGRTLVEALGSLLAQNPQEKAVVFTTYLGSVDALREQITRTLPQVQIEVLKGGDHAAKTGAQNRFKAALGPAVLICTAAGREGINLQFCRVLFNHDLPWNPMDVEQRIGRIHRYGQKSTAQVFNLVAGDTIEGQVYQLLEEKLDNIASALGKVDERGHVAEDFRAQILGQLAEQVNIIDLYRRSLADPKLVRTKEELAVALENATKSRQVVSELFQDLERFNLDDYRSLDDQGQSMMALLDFARRAAVAEGGRFDSAADGTHDFTPVGQPPLRFSTDRAVALANGGIQLLGIDHPEVQKWLEKFASLPPEERGIVGSVDGLPAGVMTVWCVTIQSAKQNRTVVSTIGLTPDGRRQIALEASERILGSIQPPRTSGMEAATRAKLLSPAAGEVLHRDLDHAGMLGSGAHYIATLLGWVETTG
ncbi:MAG: DEAD/DEAH box helicase family protein [Planctomycetes bacterium]|nr:DEAD/DEAH box helicase family protein [Planctomycetota bacterium]